jgi:hypothetical protein
MTLYQVFRCWTVYNKSRQIVIIPLLLLLYNISILLVIIYWLTVYALTGSSRVFGPYESDTILASYYAATIAINIYATCE